MTTGGGRKVALEVSHGWTYIVPSSEKEAVQVVEAVEPHLSWGCKDWYRLKPDVRRYVEPYHSLLRLKKLEFPTGLLESVKEVLEGAGWEVEVRDRRRYPEEEGKGEIPAHLNLRDYQKEAVEACLKHRHGIIKAPPGVGKTEILIACLLYTSPSPRDS